MMIHGHRRYCLENTVWKDGFAQLTVVKAEDWKDFLYVGETEKTLFHVFDGFCFNED